MSSKILFLHGAGIGNKNIFKYLFIELISYDIEGLSFDFSGYGESKTPVSQSSLKKRLNEAKNSITKFNLREPLNLCGSSMGAYIAIKLLKEYSVQNLILMAPAVYDVKAFDIPFDKKFTKIIRKKDSWKNSDAFKILKQFKGKVLIIVGENDEVIPKGLIKLYNQNLINVKFKEIIRIPNCPHRIHRWLSQNPEWKKKIAQKIVKLFH